MGWTITKNVKYLSKKRSEKKREEGKITTNFIERERENFFLKVKTNFSSDSCSTIIVSTQEQIECRRNKFFIENIVKKREIMHVHH